VALTVAASSMLLGAVPVAPKPFPSLPVPPIEHWAMPSAPVQTMTPRQAVERAADAANDIPPDAAPPGVKGSFDLRVQATDARDGKVWLNSEHDYRDQRNLTVVIPANVADSLRAKYGASPETFFRDKRIEVSGVARRATILFFDDAGRPTGKYYFQTHVQVSDPAQIRLLG
jgi:hypothetical protein